MRRVVTSVPEEWPSSIREGVDRTRLIDRLDFALWAEQNRNMARKNPRILLDDLLRLGGGGGAILFDVARRAMVVVVLPTISHKMVKENASRPR